MRYALKNSDGTVVNVIELDDVAQYAIPEGLVLVAGGDWPVEPPAPSTLPSVPETISDRQFFQQLAITGAITPDDALQAVKVGTIPANLEAFISTLAIDQQFAANMMLAGATQFNRHHPMTLALAQGMGWTNDQLDALWTNAAAL